MSRATGSAWLAGLVVGLLAGFLTLEWPSIGLLLLVAFAVPAAFVGPRRAAIGGLLGGFGGAWLGLLAMSDARCAAFDAQAGQVCIEPDLTPWIVIGGVALVIGAVLTLVGLIRPHDPSNER